MVEGGVGGREVAIALLRNVVPGLGAGKVEGFRDGLDLCGRGGKGKDERISDVGRSRSQLMEPGSYVV